MAKLKKESKPEMIGPADAELAHFNKRKKELESFRTNANGLNLEDLLRQADRDTELKPLNPERARNQNKGLNLRLSENRVHLNVTDSWQSDNSDVVVFSKIQTALSLLFDRNPGAILSPKTKRFIAKTELAKAVFEDSQFKEKFKDKFKLFVFNLAKYGWSYGRTIVKETVREFEDLTEVNPITGEKTYSPKKEIERRVDFRPLNNWNVWVDERARPYQADTIHDWMWRDVYSDDALIAEFGDTPMVRKAIQTRKGNKSSKKNSQDGDESADVSHGERTDLNEVYFYESLELDRIMAIAGGEKIYSERLPAHKGLSLINAIWNIRDDLSIYGVGLAEIMRQDKNLLDKIRNMSVDQLVLSIYKMFFYDGTLNSEDAAIRVRPGIGQRVLDPSKLKWLEVPSGGAEAYSREELIRQNLDEGTGISKALSGTVSTDPNVKALALQQSKEAALSKLKTALDNIIIALEREASIRWSLIQELNMFPTEVEKLIEPEKVKAYLDEIEGNKDLYYLDRDEMAVYALRFPEIAANVKLGEDGVYRASQEKMFFHVTPELIRWCGDIKFTAESILVVNKELQKQMDLDMANLILPLLVQPPQVYLKPVKQILKLYGKDEEDWLPDSWLHPEAAPPTDETGGNPAMGLGPEQPVQGGGPMAIPGLPQAETVVAPRETQPGRGTRSPIDKMTARGILE